MQFIDELRTRFFFPFENLSSSRAVRTCVVGVDGKYLLTISVFEPQLTIILYPTIDAYFHLASNKLCRNSQRIKYLIERNFKDSSLTTSMTYLAETTHRLIARILAIAIM